MDINGKQRLILKIVIGVIIVMVLFPPFRHGGGMGEGSVGYRFYFTEFDFILDSPKLIAQLLIAAFIGCAVFLLAKDKND